MSADRRAFDGLPGETAIDSVQTDPPNDGENGWSEFGASMNQQDEILVLQRADGCHGRPDRIGSA